MMTSLPHLDLDTDTPSGRTTPSDERVPLFSHECLHSPDCVDHESPPRVQQRESYSPSSQVTEEAIIDYDDPTLEKFPTERMAVLEQIRSIESRLSVDEVRDDGSRSPVVVSPRNGSPGLWSPSSTGLGSKNTPPLEVISEEDKLPDGSFAKLPSPVTDVDIKISAELEVIPEEFQDPEISHTKPSNPVNNFEQLGNTNAVTDSVAKPMLALTPKDDQQEGLIESQEPILIKDLMRSKESTQLEDSINVHEPMKAAQELFNAKEPLEFQKSTQVGQPTSDEVGGETESSKMAVPLLEHEKLLEAEEPNSTAELPTTEEPAQAQKTVLIDKDPQVAGPPMAGPFLRHKMSTGAEEPTSVEESKTQPETIKIPATEPGSVNLILEDRKTSVEAASTAEIEEAPKFNEPNADVLDQSKLVEPVTDGSREEPPHDEPKEAKQPQGHTALEEMAQSEDVERNPDVDELRNSQNLAEVSETENSHLGSSEINDMKNVGKPLARESIGNYAGESFVTAAPEAEMQDMEQNVAPKDSVTHIISLTPEVDPLAAIGSVHPDSAHQSSSGEEPAVISAMVDERDQKPVFIVENPGVVDKEEDPTTSTEGYAAKVTGGIPECLVDENTSAAAGGEDLLVTAADEAAPTTAHEDHSPATGADLGASTLVAGEDLSTTTPDVDGQNIGAGEGIPAVTVDNDSPPFLVHTAQTDPLKTEEVTPVHTNGIDTAKSTSLEESPVNNNDSNLKTRISSTIERPVTPASIHSALNSKESSNFFKALWRTVFVGWIGGLFHRVFGGGRSS